LHVLTAVTINQTGTEVGLVKNDCELWLLMSKVDMTDSVDDN